MTYRVVLSRQAERYYAQAPRDVAQRLAAVFRDLEMDIRPRGARPLKGELRGLFRIRVGDLRVVYVPRPESAEIRVLRIGPRGDTY